MKRSVCILITLAPLALGVASATYAYGNALTFGPLYLSAPPFAVTAKSETAPRPLPAANPHGAVHAGEAFVPAQTMFARDHTVNRVYPS